MGTITTPRPVYSIPSRMERQFAAQRVAAGAEPSPTRAVRLLRLEKLESMLRENMDALTAALCEDFGNRCAAESRLLEMFPTLESVRHARRHLARWMRDARRPASMWFRPGRARVVFQPLGVIGIIAPWNYPVLLSMSPLVSAVAAGNRAMVKVSELTPRTSALLAVLVARYFAPEEVAVIEGDAAVGESFASLPFDHLIFTGSTRVGHEVMRAAADHLTPVTLELGGKSPAIVGPGANFQRALTRIVAGKTMNAGQTCIAPDYVLLPTGRENAFIDAARRVVDGFYPDLARTGDYASIISQRHFERLQGLLAEARERGARIEPLSTTLTAPDAGRRRFPPVAVVAAPADCALMREEIFGPILPLVPYAELDAAIRYVNERPRPLALYYFDSDSQNVDRVLRNTVSGGVTINDTILHIAQDELPFGGVGPSGMGRYHGREGFETFSNKKAVFLQSRINGVGLFNPPFGRRFERLMKLMLR